MRHTIRVASLLAALIIGTSLAPIALADDESPTPVTLEQAAEMVQERTGGRVLKAKQVKKDDRVHYQIRVLTGPGEVRVYRVDPDTGELF